MGEFNIGQQLVARTMRPVLETLLIENHTLTRFDDVEFIMDRSITQAVRHAGAVLFHPVAAADRRQSLREIGGGDMALQANQPVSRDQAKVMNRFDITKRMVARLRHDEAVIGGIGYTNFDLWAVGHRPQNFYMLGTMGLAVPIGVGVALAQPQRKVIALEGDGSILMQLGSLATVAARGQKNLAIVIMDNGAYQITGGQKTLTEEGADIVAIARGCGLAPERLGRR